VSQPGGGLGVTAIYTSQVARWGGLAHASLYDGGPGRVVFWLTSLFVGLGRLVQPGVPSLAVSILHRQVLFDRILERLGAQAVMELAAGLSRRGVLLSDDPRVQVVELDVPEVVKLKEELLARSPQGRAVLERGNLRRVGLDLGDPRLDDAALAAQAPPGSPLVVTAEGLCMYLSASAQRALWSRVQALLAARGGGSFVFDLVPAVEQAPPGRVGRLLGRLMAAFTGGQGFVRDERGRADIVEELRGLGFSSVEAIEPRLVAEEWALPRPRERSQQVVFLARVERGLQSV